ncbi:DNA cytosine methyltransferase [Hylemonella gracilis]|uniref:DNA cytosine methyltransferase n=1 Tax=Hylemonella gracilis TaxID=80880 RepID=UPI0009E0A272|nr:DNA (cytosine-5-)-methyltransferase [Hylemonella gracilis]
MEEKITKQFEDFQTEDCAQNLNEIPVRYAFVDLFSGLGGFRVGLERLGHRCVFSSEIDEELRSVYLSNFGELPAGDIREVQATDVPQHNILCAGFPCQPFSLAGKKRGAACPDSGRLIDDVLRIADHHRPKYVFLENVPNVLTIADGSFWKYVVKGFRRLGYHVDHRVYSPLQFGIPQQRLRVFIVARRNDIPAFEWPDPISTKVKPLAEFLENHAGEDVRRIEPAKSLVLEKWAQFVRRIRPETSSTILAPEFGATYPLDGLPLKGWRRFKGAYGISLAHAADRNEALELLPHYARSGTLPKWLRRSPEISRELYKQDSDFLDEWKIAIEKSYKSWQMLEWRGDRSKFDLWSHTIQFRASGIRVMRSHLVPSLVAMTPTQTPIIGKRKRYLAVREAASLQSLEELRVFPESSPRAFRALGNAVNARIVTEVARAAIR